MSKVSLCQNHSIHEMLETKNGENIFHEWKEMLHAPRVTLTKGQ